MVVSSCVRLGWENTSCNPKLSNNVTSFCFSVLFWGFFFFYTFCPINSLTFLFFSTFFSEKSNKKHCVECASSIFTSKHFWHPSTDTATPHFEYLCLLLGRICYRLWTHLFRSIPVPPRDGTFFTKNLTSLVYKCFDSISCWNKHVLKMENTSNFSQTFHTFSTVNCQNPTYPRDS